MKVLLVTSMFPPYGGGGVSTHVGDLAHGLAAAGHAVTVLSCRRGMSRDPKEGDHAPHGVRVIFARDFWRMFLAIGRLVRRERFDVVHLHSFNALALGLLVRGGPHALVFTFHSDTALYFASVRGWRSRYHPGFVAVRVFQRLSADVPDLVIAVSHSALEGAERIGLRRVVDIPNAVDVAVWQAAGAPSQASHAILVPRMHVPKNGIDVAIRSMPQILEAVPDAKLWITGDGPLRPALEKEAATIARDRIEFLGLVSPERMRGLYADAGVIMIPSVDSAGMREPFGIAALEAMASRRPVIVSNVGGLPEVVRDGIDGCVVPEKDPDALAHAAVRILRDPRLAAQLAQAGRERAVEEFSVETWTRKVVAAYDRGRQIHADRRAG